MTNIRVLAERDLKDSIEGEFKLPVVLTAPDGMKFPVCGRVVYVRTQTNFATGEIMSITDPVVILRKSSLVRVPVPGERWMIEIPINPVDSDTELYILDNSRVVVGRGLGAIRFPLIKIERRVG